MNWHVTQVTGNETVGKHAVSYVVTWSGKSGRWNAKATADSSEVVGCVRLIAHASTIISRDRCVELIRSKAVQAVARCNCSKCE